MQRPRRFLPTTFLTSSRATSFLLLLISLLTTLALTACNDKPDEHSNTAPNCDGFVVNGECKKLTPCTEDSQCSASGAFCFGGYCQTKETMCNFLDCKNKPGVCSTTEKACVNADAGSCRPGENDCLLGYACNSQTMTCEKSVVTNCTGGSCGLCTNTSGCANGEQCFGGVCKANLRCEPDVAEPNNKQAESKPIYHADNTPFTLCKGDVDWFTYEFQGGYSLGDIFQATIQLQPESVGFKKIKAQLLDKHGQELAEGSNVDKGVPGSTIELAYTPPANGSTREVFIKIFSDDTTKEGLVRYTLGVAMLQPGSKEVCSDPTHIKELPLNSIVEGSLANPDLPVELQACGGGGGPTTPKEIWHFSLKRTSKVSLNLSVPPNGGYFQPPFLELRSNCANPSALLNTCPYLTPTTPDFSGLLEPGDYYVVVYNPGGPNNDKYKLALKIDEVTCTEGNNVCNENTYTYCDISKQLLVTQTCPHGCDTQRNKCRDKEGDTCQNPFVVDPTTGLSKKIQTSEFNSLALITSCQGLPSYISNPPGPPSTTYSLTLPAGKTVIAKSQGALAISEAQCAEHLSSCTAAGANIASWKNTGTTDVNLLLYAFHNPDQPTDQVDIEIKETSCAPGEFQCVANKEKVCSPLGEGFINPRSCSNGCGSDNRCLPETGEVCTTPKVLATTDFNKDILLNNNNFTKELLTPPSCTDGTKPFPLSEPGNVFRFPVKKDHLYEITLDSSGSYSYSDSSLWISDSCDTNTKQTRTCLTAIQHPIQREKQTLRYQSTADGEKLLVVQGRYFNGKKIRIEEHPVSTTTASPECVAGNHIKYYDSFNVERSYSCACTTGESSCTSSNKNTCFSAKSLYNGAVAASGSESDTLSSSITAFLPPIEEKLDSCSFAQPGQPLPPYSGEDRFYKFDLKKKDLLEIVNQRTDQDYTIFLQKNCGSIKGKGSCLANLKKDSHVNKLTYYAKDDETVYLVAKKEKQNNRTTYVDFHWKVTKGKEPADAITSPICKDATHIQYRTQDGKLIEQECECKSNSCTYDSSKGKACSSPIEVGKGGAFLIHSQRGKSSINHSDLASCSIPGGASKSIEGPETIFKVSAEQGELISAEMRNSGNARFSLYVLEDNCSQISCLSSYVTHPYNRPIKIAHKENLQSKLEFVAPRKGDYLIVVDQHKDNTPGLPAYVLIRKDSKDTSCGSFTPTCNGDRLEYCSQGFKKEIECVGGCSAGKCQEPYGEVCADAFPLITPYIIGNSFANSPSRDHLPLEGGMNGACGFNHLPSRGEVYYSFKLKPGEQVKIEQPSNNRDIFYYITGDCNTSSCLATPTGDGTLLFRPEISTETTYYLVLEGIESSSPVSYFSPEIRVTIENATGECAPGQVVCTDETSSQAKVCGSDKHYHNVTCVDGCKKGSACIIKPEKAKVCGDAPTILSGNASHFAGWIPLTEMTTQSSAIAYTCPGDALDLSLPGLTSYFKVELKAYETANITLGTPYLQGNDGALLYFFKDCQEMEKSCQLAKKTAATGKISYQASSKEETIYVGVTSLSPQQRTAFIQGEITPAPCTIGSTTCASGTISYCDPASGPQNFTCSGTCNSSGTACSTPTGATCADPILVSGLSSTPTTKTGTLSHPNRLISFPERNKCTGDLTNGSEMIYQVEVEAGKKLTAELESKATTKEDLALYILKDCFSPMNTCLQGSDLANADGKETVTHTAGSTKETVFVVVDSASNATGDFSLSFKVE